MYDTTSRAPITECFIYIYTQRCLKVENSVRCKRNREAAVFFPSKSFKVTGWITRHLSNASLWDSTGSFKHIWRTSTPQPSWRHGDLKRRENKVTQSVLEEKAWWIFLVLSVTRALYSHLQARLIESRLVPSCLKAHLHFAIVRATLISNSITKSYPLLNYHRWGISLYKANYGPRAKSPGNHTKFVRGLKYLHFSLYENNGLYTWKVSSNRHTEKIQATAYWFSKHSAIHSISIRFDTVHYLAYTSYSRRFGSCLHSPP